MCRVQVLMGGVFEFFVGFDRVNGNQRKTLGLVVIMVRGFEHDEG